MKRMWSPWRSQYIKTFSGSAHPRRKQSVFTAARKSDDDAANLVVWRGEHCFLIMNRYPYNSGHLLVVPNRQVATLQDLRSAELTEIMETVQRAIKALDALLHPQGYNFGANFGRAAGAGVDTHLNFHIVPRWNGDTNFMPVLSDTKLISEDMKTTWKSLRKRLG